jgi:tRNA modification GTPase
MRERQQQADLVIWCTAAGIGMEESLADAAAREDAALAATLLPLITKCDSAPAAMNDSALRVSARTGRGLDELRRRIREHLEEADSGRGELLSSTLARCQGSLKAAGNALRQAIVLAEAHAGEELIALELRRGLDALGEIAGVIYTDDLLDRIFSRFCIGK